MSFGDAISTCFNKYAEFRGRARRSEYWWFYLFTLIVTYGLLLAVSSVLSMVASLALFVPGLAVGVRRMHDTNRSGWYLLIALIPLVGIIILIVWLATEGDPAANQYGESPKAVAI